MRGSRKGKVFVMEQMTMVNEQVEVKSVETPEQVRSGSARMRELTPAQRRAVMFAQQQVLRARAAKEGQGRASGRPRTHVAGGRRRDRASARDGAPS